MAPRQTKWVQWCGRASTWTGWSASRLPWMSLRTANRIRLLSENPGGRRNIQLLFQMAESRDQCRKPLLLAAIVQSAQIIISFVLPSFAIGEFVGGRTFVISGAAGQPRCSQKILRCPRMIIQLVAVQTCQRFVKLRVFRIVGDAALQKISSQLDIFAL